MKPEHTKPIVGWNDKRKNDPNESRDERLKRISSIPPDQYAKTILGSVEGRARKGQFSLDPTYGI